MLLWLLQSQENAVHKLESCCSLQTRCPIVQSALLSPVRDVDDGFAELNDFGCDPEADRSVTKTNAADQEAADVCCRKRRRGATDSGDHDSSSAHTSEHLATSPTCFVGHETPTSSKQSVKRAKECVELSCSCDGERAGARRLVRCHSEAVIHQALSMSEQQANLVGDFSRPHSLPLVTAAKHPDLKTISPDTVSSCKIFSLICLCIRRPTMSVKALCFRLSSPLVCPFICSSVCPVRCCYQGVSSTARTIWIKLVGNVH